MKRICNLATIHPRNDVRIFRKECFAETQRYEVHYVTCDGKGYELKSNVHIHGIKKYKSKLLRAIFAPFRVYRKAKAIDADIYVLHDPELLSVVLLLKKRGKCVVWDCHEYYTGEHTKSTNCKQRLLLKMLHYFLVLMVRVCVPYLDGIIVVTHELKIRLKKICSSKILILQNYAALNDFPTVRMSNFKHAQCILYTGSLLPGLFHLIHALALCKSDVKCILAYRSVHSEDRQIFAKCPFDLKKVILKENICLEEIKLLSEKCFTAAVIHGPKSELFYSGVKTYEYMAECLPIISVGSTNDTLLKTQFYNDGHPLGLIVDADPQAIANAIDYLYEHKEVARTMGMNGRKAFETKYNFESEADGFLKFLEEVSQSKKSK